MAAGAYGRIAQMHPDDATLLVSQARMQLVAKDFEGAVQVRQAELETVINQARQTQPGSPEFQRFQIQLMKLQTDLQQFVAKGRHDLQQKEVEQDDEQQP